MTGDDPGVDPFGFYAPASVSTLSDEARSVALPPAAPPRRARRGTRTSTTITLASVLVAAVIGVHAARAGAHHAAIPALSGDLTAASPASGGAPPLTKVSHPQRLLPAVTPPAGAGGYTFEAAGRWDPCRPIRYVVSGSEPFPGADAMLAQALDEAGAASGLRFVDAGRTTEPAATDRAAYQPDRYGQMWAPVLVAWTDEAHVPALAGNVIGLGGAFAADVKGSTRLVSGLLYFDEPELFLISQRGTGYAAMRTVMLHEIGHLLGLGHVQDPGAVMFPSDGAQGDYAAGDLRGLAYAGAAPCSPYS